MNHPIRCLIAGDEPFARKGLQGYIEKTDFLMLSAPACEDAFQLQQALEKTETDLLYLDIEMTYLSGIDFLKSLPVPPKVVFTTDCEQYARGFELDIMDYLLKPISYERFLHSAEKIRDYLHVLRVSEKEIRHIFIKTDRKIKKLFFDEILYIEAMENYLSIRTKEARHIIHGTFKNFIEKLPSGFVQTHKSYVVSIEKITAMDGNTLHLGNHQVPVSKAQKAMVRNLLLSQM
jgi:DNA-binding LytR/AlgR family response regulator